LDSGNQYFLYFIKKQQECLAYFKDECLSLKQLILIKAYLYPAFLNLSLCHIG